MSEDMPPLLLHDFMTVQEKLYLLTFTFTSCCTQLSLLLQKASLHVTFTKKPECQTNAGMHILQ